MIPSKNKWMRGNIDLKRGFSPMKTCFTADGLPHKCWATAHQADGLIYPHFDLPAFSPWVSIMAVFYSHLVHISATSIYPNLYHWCLTEVVVTTTLVDGKYNQTSITFFFPRTVQFSGRNHFGGALFPLPKMRSASGAPWNSIRWKWFVNNNNLWWPEASCTPVLISLTTNTDSLQLLDCFLGENIKSSD